MKKIIAERIRRARVIQNLSQENVATDLGISVGAYSNIERGKTDVTVSRLYAIAKILKTTVPEILSGKEDLSDEKNANSNYPLLREKGFLELNELREQINLLKKEVASIKSQRSKNTRRK